MHWCNEIRTLVRCGCTYWFGWLLVRCGLKVWYKIHELVSVVA